MLRSIYSNLITKLVISGYSDAYERTFPKNEETHQDYEDPSEYIDPKHPAYINVNGLNFAKNTWLQQKQPWSAFLRLTPSYGILTTLSEGDLVYS